MIDNRVLRSLNMALVEWTFIFYLFWRIITFGKNTLFAKYYICFDAKRCSFNSHLTLSLFSFYIHCILTIHPRVWMCVKHFFFRVYGTNINFDLYWDWVTRIRLNHSREVSKRHSHLHINSCYWPRFPTKHDILVIIIIFLMASQLKWSCKKWKLDISKY